MMTHNPSLTTLARANRVMLILLTLVVLLPLYSQGQNLKLGFRGGASFANFFNHNNSLPSVPVPGRLSAMTSPSNELFAPGRTDFDTYTRPAYYKTDLIKDVRTGFYAGLFLEIVLNDRWSLEPGIGYTQKGIDLDYTTVTTAESGMNRYTTAYSFRRNIHTDYLSVPLVAKYTLDRKGRFYLIGGLYTAFALRSKIVKAEELYQTNTIYNGNPIYSGSTITTTDNYTKTFDAGVTAGGGVKFPLSGVLSIGFDLRANVGAINIRGKSEQQDYLSFSSNALNINTEAGVRLAYTLPAH